MATAEPFMVGPPDERNRPWRVVVGAEQTGGMSLGMPECHPAQPAHGQATHPPAGCKDVDGRAHCP